MVATSTSDANGKPLAQFAREIDLPSKHSPYFQKWDHARRKLSDLAWDVHSANAYAHYRAVNPGLAALPLSRTGVYDQGRLNTVDTGDLLKLFHECPLAPYSADDFHDGYSFDPTGSLADYNTYRKMTPAFEAKLGEVLLGIAPAVEEICGHHFRIVSSHIWSLNPGPHRYQWHLDWWPVALKKLFIFPSGVDKNRGSTAFRLKTGEEKIIEGPPGTWMIFENSGVEHKGFESLTDARPTIAISFAPAFRTDLRLFDAGCNSGYPWFPHEDPFSHAQVPDEFSPDDFKLRTLRRIMDLAGLGVTLTTDGMVQIPEKADPMPQAPAQATAGLATRLRRKLGSIRRRLLSP